MQEIKDEDRIIGKICRGELSFDREDIKNLENANLSKDEEENFRKLAQEINDKLNQNQQVKEEMKEQIKFVEKDHFVKETLEKIDNKINELKFEHNKKCNPSTLMLTLGTFLVLGLGFAMPLFVSLFTNSIWALGAATFCGFFTGVGIDVSLIVKNQNKLEKIKKQIKDLEKARLEIIEDGINETKTQENKAKINIVRDIYKERKEEIRNEDVLNF